MAKGSDSYELDMDEVKQRMVNCSLKQSDLPEILGITKSGVDKIFATTGGRTSLETLRLLARRLKCTPEDLLKRFKPVRLLNLDEWLSGTLGCSPLIEQRAEQENVRYRHLCVGSAVELCHPLRYRGWKTSKDLSIHEVSGEAVRRFRAGFDRYYPPAEFDLYRGEDDRPNFALLAVQPHLSDVPGCQLEVAVVPHGLVRYVADNFAEQCLSAHPRLFDSDRIELPNSIVVHLSVLTLDNKLLIGQRSGSVRFYERTWATTCEEHVMPRDDGFDPFAAARRGIKEELIGEREGHRLRDDVRIELFSIFREYDEWHNRYKEQTFWDINVGIAGVARLPLTSAQVFKLWLDAEDKREYEHLVAVDYTFDNVLKLATSDTFNPTEWSGGITFPPGVNPAYPDLDADPLLKRQHPTNKIRLARLLTADHLGALEQYARLHSLPTESE